MSPVARLPRWSLRSGSVLFRLSRRFGPDHRPRGPWFFSSSGSPSPGRFDLPAPRGTCYFATSALGAWLEVFGSVALVDEMDVRRRSLAVATRSGAALSLADLASPRAAAAGVSLDLVAGDDYSAPQEVALDAFRRGAAGLRALLRRDPSGTSHNIALFGRSGAPTKQAGWLVTRLDPGRSTSLMAALAGIGVRVVPVPREMPIAAPPRRRPRDR